MFLPSFVPQTMVLPPHPILDPTPTELCAMVQGPPEHCSIDNGPPSLFIKVLSPLNRGPLELCATVYGPSDLCATFYIPPNHCATVQEPWRFVPQIMVYSSFVP